MGEPSRILRAALKLSETNPNRHIPLHQAVSVHSRLSVSLLTAAAATAAKSFQSCLTLCDLIDGSPAGSPIAGILQAGTLEWVAISFSNA